VNQSLASALASLFDEIAGMRNLVSQRIVPIILYVLNFKPDATGQHDSSSMRATHLHFDCAVCKTVFYAFNGYRQARDVYVVSADNCALGTKRLPDRYHMRYTEISQHLTVHRMCTVNGELGLCKLWRWMQNPWTYILPR
jgi:hypothetical protein